jgi:hypothetical protein
MTTPVTTENEQEMYRDWAVSRAEQYQAGAQREQEMHVDWAERRVEMQQEWEAEPG